MSSTVFTSLSDRETTIRVNGPFNFELLSRFRTAYHTVAADGPRGQHFVIDLIGTEYIDSSGMDLLLLMRDEVGADQATIDIVHTRPEIRRLLEMAGLHRLFTIT